MAPRAGRDGVRRVLTRQAWRQLDPVRRRVLSRRGVPPRLGTREFLEAVLFLARAGTPWRDLPPCFGARDAVYRRSRRRQKAGAWEAIWRALRAPAAASARRIFADSPAVRARQHAAGGRGEDRAPGRSRGGFGTKIHPAAADERTALGVILTGGQAGDAPAPEPVMCDVPDEADAKAVVADRAYDSDAIRSGLEAAGSEW